MKTSYADQYLTPCVNIEPGDTAVAIINEAYDIGATYEEEPGETTFVVQFPNRFPEVYTEDALTRSLPV